MRFCSSALGLVFILKNVNDVNAKFSSKSLSPFMIKSDEYSLKTQTLFGVVDDDKKKELVRLDRSLLNKGVLDLPRGGAENDNNENDDEDEEKKEPETLYLPGLLDATVSKPSAVSFFYFFLTL